VNLQLRISATLNSVGAGLKPALRIYFSAFLSARMAVSASAPLSKPK
jgi:hypothetical protein